MRPSETSMKKLTFYALCTSYSYIVRKMYVIKCYDLKELSKLNSNTLKMHVTNAL